MKRTWIRLLPAVFALIGACSGSANPMTSPEPSVPAVSVYFRALVDQAVVPSCVEAPEWALAAEEGDWIDIFDRETDCQPDADVMLPEVDFARQVGLVVWWTVVSCAQTGVRTESVQRSGSTLTVTAVRVPAPPGCAPHRATLESVLALDRWEGFTGAEMVRLVLDGKAVPVGDAGE